MDTLILEQLIEELKVMPENLQYQVLEFARTLVGSQIHGVPGRELLNFAGTIPPDDILLMSRAIEQGCEQVDIDEW
ncbi:hypothetical protein G7B40_030425 [Aetokthonos hydrillicola Thurmond2011]|jgi:hypothetical protein|uniref:DUF2281 domain-containing protein n=1 Tax=Aetokthonos hydrillicola Thurmond2011 TaxID=2712845 RepID=A0AAP5IEW0_9CYAN|nr:hypothetical protein [Aetokthonos hydrillicola]MBO3457362.1 hypothetical protein [Aetokthonos hydrillicola CCALA 1050]MBW4583962.1 hypothetical protein [Aetokthonos hydrillicola CCALA 1050]MDR9898842.1 hypothetical protein [Aetokthonos hydrillicola Thurmond2011]